MKAGMPVCVGYFSVSFGFGAMAIAQGLTIWQAILISASNLTSAGQFAGLTVIAAGAAILEMILTQVVINSRYALMSLALGQRLGQNVGTLKRLAVAFFNTDEVFALGMSRGKNLTPAFFVGAGTVAAIGWTSGTALGAVAGSLLPVSVRMALGVMLYTSAAYTPLPGASGAQEGVFALYFANIFPDGIRLMALLLWRFFTYYLALIVGAVTTVVQGFQSGEKKPKHRKTVSQEEQAPPEA